MGLLDATDEPGKLVVGDSILIGPVCARRTVTVLSWANEMVGVITSRDVLLHPIATIRGFGWRIFFRAVSPWHEKTFLALLWDADFFGAATSKVPELLGRCIGLELQAKRIYAALAEGFANLGSIGRFFEALAEQEQDHADLLELCRAAAIRGGWKANYFNPWQEYIPRLEQQMEEVEAAVYSIGSVDDALRLVIRIESCEINEIFEAVLAASDSAFVRRLRAFRDAMERHMVYICERIPELAPHLMLACRELRAKIPRVK